jgi:hypothetical protein
MIPASVRIIRRRGFNKCFGLRVLTFEEGSCVHVIGGFAKSALTSVMFPRSLVMLVSEAFNHSQELSLSTFEDGSLIGRIEGLTGINRGSLCFPDSVGERPDFVQ